MYKEITKCRISESPNLISVLNLGKQALTGVFPKGKDTPITSGPLELVWCPKSELLQLKHSYYPEEMYGDNYGYRSGLNRSMVNHLKAKVEQLQRLYPLQSGDIVLDIGSNDATLLKHYSNEGLRRIGIDPTGVKFKEYYTGGIELIPDFFSATAFKKMVSDKKAKIITSIAMFYDLESPLSFIKQVAESLDDDGIWHLEQSYMPSMLRMNSYDTVCHEHLEYYSLTPIKRMLDQCDLKLLDVQMNSINGGSFALTVAKSNNSLKENQPIIEWFLSQEERMGLNTPKPFRDFEERVFKHRDDLMSLIQAITTDGKKVFGYGASTKGNVLLQFCGLSEKEIPCIAEVNPDKFGCFTPGTYIPIVSEAEAKAMSPDYFLVLPWHFKENILAREQEFLSKGGKFIFPLPEIEIV